MRKGKIVINIIEKDLGEGIKYSNHVICEASANMVLSAIPRLIVQIENSLPEKAQAGFRADFLEELNIARKEILENENK